MPADNRTTLLAPAQFIWPWLISISEIAPGSTAIIGGNRIAFFAIHQIALCLITISVVASIIVICNIHSKWRRHTTKLDFPIRFPLYLAIADTLWGVAHFLDHFYLVTEQKYSNNTIVKFGLGMPFLIFLGYQQVMHISVAGYTYLRVVHNKKLELGKWEWKLHSLWFLTLIGTAVFFAVMGSFGNSGYWICYNATTLSGQLFGAFITSMITFNAFVTTLGYRRIRRAVNKVKSKLNAHTRLTDNRQESTASQCLTTFVCLASWIYVPWAVLAWIQVVLLMVLGATEPLTSLSIVFVANSSGWANAAGYFYNKRLKRKEKGKCSRSNPNSTVQSIIVSQTSSYEA